MTTTPATQALLPVTPEATHDWIDVAVTSAGCFIIDCDHGFKEFLNGVYWEDNFQCDPPVHLANGAYRWSGFKVGYWGEDEGMNIVGGDFAALTPSALSGDAGEGEVIAALETLIRKTRIQATCLEHYAEQSGFSAGPIPSVFHLQAAHFRTFTDEAAAAIPSHQGAGE